MTWFGRDPKNDWAALAAEQERRRAAESGARHRATRSTDDADASIDGWRRRASSIVARIRRAFGR